MVRDSVCVLPLDTLRKPGAIKLVFPERSDLANSYVCVPGTTIMNRAAKARDTIIIDSVPAGILNDG
jgi:hypothetical protein